MTIGILGLDISTTSSGLALWVNGGITLMNTISADNSKNMLDKLSNVVRSVIDSKPDNVELYMVTEHFTQTIVNNDRLGKVEELLAIKNEIVQFVKSRNVNVCEITPWCWRKEFNLSTIVKSPNNDHRLVGIAKLCGHDILKNESVEFVNTNKEYLFGETSINSLASDDEAEAVLLIGALRKRFEFGDYRNIYDDKHYQIRYLNSDDILRVIELLEVSNG